MSRSGCLSLSLLCGGGLERAARSTDQLASAPGGRVELSLANSSAATLGVNRCLRQLVSVDAETRGRVNLEACDLDVAPLEAGAEKTVRRTLPPTITPGTWRSETTIRLPSGQGERLYAAPFTVSAR